MPSEIKNETAALDQFKAEFTKRYCQHQAGPNLSTKIFEEVVQEAFGGSAQTRKALGKLL